MLSAARKSRASFRARLRLSLQPRPTSRLIGGR